MRPLRCRCLHSETKVQVLARLRIQPIKQPLAEEAHSVVMLQRSNYPNVTQKEVTFSALRSLMLDLFPLDCAYTLQYFHLLVFFSLPSIPYRKPTLNLSSWYICYMFRLLSPAYNSPNVLSLGASSKFHLVRYFNVTWFRFLSNLLASNRELTPSTSHFKLHAHLTTQPS